MTVDRLAARGAIESFLRALGHDPKHHEELRDTPERVVEAWADELLSGHAVDVAALLAEGVTASGSDLVVLRDIAVSVMCPHHLLPSQGSAVVAYEPGARLFGLGTLALLVDAYARRLSLQEIVGRSIVDALLRDGGASGAFCRLELRHACLAARGERRPEAAIVTVASAGSLATAQGAAKLRLALDRVGDG